MEDQNTPIQQTVSPTPAPEPAKKSSSWGAIIAILLILGMIVVGAFYAWGKRISEQSGYTASLPLA